MRVSPRDGLQSHPRAATHKLPSGLLAALLFAALLEESARVATTMSAVVVAMLFTINVGWWETAEQP